MHSVSLLVLQQDKTTHYTLLRCPQLEPLCATLESAHTCILAMRTWAVHSGRRWFCWLLSPSLWQLPALPRLGSRGVCRNIPLPLLYFMTNCFIIMFARLRQKNYLLFSFWTTYIITYVKIQYYNITTRSIPVCILKKTPMNNDINFY